MFFVISFLMKKMHISTFFFYNFGDVYVVQNRVLRLSKSLFRETNSIKEITYEPSIEYQSHKLTAELHPTRKEFFLIKKIQS